MVILTGTTDSTTTLQSETNEPRGVTECGTGKELDMRPALSSQTEETGPVMVSVSSWSHSKFRARKETDHDSSAVSRAQDRLSGSTNREKEGKLKFDLEVIFTVMKMWLHIHVSSAA